MANSCKPPKNDIRQTMEAHPSTELLKQIFLTIIKTINTKAIKHNTITITDDSTSGAVVNAKIHSMLYLKSDQKDHFVSPAIRSTFSNSIHFVL